MGLAGPTPVGANRPEEGRKSFSDFRARRQRPRLWLGGASHRPRLELSQRHGERPAESSSSSELARARLKCLPGQHSMVAEDFIQDPEIRDWLAGVEPAWTLLTFESLQALRREPSAIQTAIWIANDLSVGEIASSPVARNTLILLREAIGPARSNRQPIQCCCSGRDVEWPDYD